MRFAIALLFGLLISSFGMASETLALIESSSVQPTVSAEASMDGWNGTSHNSFDELVMGQSLDSKELSEPEEEVNALPIPEPAAAAILLAGLGSMGWMRYRLG